MSVFNDDVDDATCYSRRSHRMVMRHVVLITNNVDPAALAAGVAACSSLTGLNLAAVIVTGRWAHWKRGAERTEHSLVYSKTVLQRNTRRMAGTLARLKGRVSVFEGLIPPATTITHFRHIEELQLDLHQDAGYALATGDFMDAMRSLMSLPGDLDLVVCGPLTEVREIMREPRLRKKLRTLTCLQGAYATPCAKTIRVTPDMFNSGCDWEATRTVLREFPGSLYLMPPSLLPGLKKVGMSSASELLAQGASDELVRLLTIFEKAAPSGRGGVRLDHLHPVLFRAQFVGSISNVYCYYDFGVSEERSGDNEIVFEAGKRKGAGPRRYAVTGVYVERFGALLGKVLANPYEL